MKIKTLALMAGSVLFLLASCASKPVHLGIYNPERIQEDDLVTLFVDRYIKVNAMDSIKVDWSENKYSQRIIKIPPGAHTFSANFDDGNRFTWLPTWVTGLFEKGNTYLLKVVINKEKGGNRVSFHIVLYNDNKEGDEVTLDLARLRGNDSSTLSHYIKYVLNPRMKDDGNSVKLENDQCILIYKPDLLYTLTNKETGLTTEGRAGFSMNFSMTTGKAFLLETDISEMSSEQFLASNYSENAQTILVPIACSETEVTYRYEKPLELQGRTVTFSITEIPRT
jgi:hypothetical protein